MTTVSLVIPVYDESANLIPLYERLVVLLEQVCDSFEILFVDDGSRDGSASILEELHRKDGRVKACILSRNFGHQAALTAGIDLAKGSAVIMMDGDLQHPPELIPTLIAEWKNGYQIVFTVRQYERNTSFLKRGSSWLFYRIFKATCRVDLPLGSADFRLLDRQVVNHLKGFEERCRFLRGLIAWMGFPAKAVPYTSQKRPAGRSKYSLVKMCLLAIDGIVSFSSLPLLFSFVCGCGMAGLGFFYLLYTIYVRLISSIPPQTGWASILATTLILGGIQLVSVGLLGLYLGKVYEEVKKRPLYLEKKLIGISDYYAWDHAVRYGSQNF